MFNPLSSKTQTIALWKIFDKEDEGLNPDRIVVGQLLKQMDIKTLQRELLVCAMEDMEMIESLLLLTIFEKNK